MRFLLPSLPPSLLPSLTILDIFHPHPYPQSPAPPATNRYPPPPSPLAPLPPLSMGYIGAMMSLVQQSIVSRCLLAVALGGTDLSGGGEASSRSGGAEMLVFGEEGLGLGLAARSQVSFFLLLMLLLGVVGVWVGVRGNGSGTKVEEGCRRV